MKPARSRSRGFALASLASAIVAVWLAALAAAGQQPGGTSQQPTFRGGVNFVRVDVYPSANGRIVPDLKQDEFEVLEDGVPQRVETFEHVVVRAPGAEMERSADPSTVRESNEAAGNPRNRLFVLFLDSYHVSVDFSTLSVSNVIGETKGSGGGVTEATEAKTGVSTSRKDSRIGGALVRFFDRLIGPDDLVGLLRPEEPVTALTFTRRPASFYDLLMSGGWERRFVRDDFDEREKMYRACYGNDSDVAARMIARRRERMVLDALHALVTHLQNLREERKAIIVVTEGWPVFRPDPTLKSQDQLPKPPPIGVAGGQPAIVDSRVGNIRADCERDRMLLADLDDERDFRAMLDEANRANASFYPIDPRGLPVFDTPISQPVGSPAADARALHAGLDALQTMAGATDGIALVNENDLSKSLARISEDLSSYYLLGYYSTNPKHDGKFRKITVRVKRAGVTVRARRGYLAATEEEVKASEAARIDADPAARSVGAALETLEFSRPGQVIRVRGGYTWPAAARAEAGSATARMPAASPAQAVLSVVAELDANEARAPSWAGGGDLSASILDLDGRVLGTASGKLSPSARACLIRFTDTPLPAADYVVAVKAQWSVLTTTEKVRIKVPDVSQPDTNVLGQPIVSRRGPYSGPGFQPTADLRFRRAERVRLDVPLAGRADSVAGRLLDRKGKPLPVPVNASVRADGAFSFVTAEVVLAPLALSDYVIEVSVRRGEKTDKVLTAIRIVP